MADNPQSQHQPKGRQKADKTLESASFLLARAVVSTLEAGLLDRIRLWEELLGRLRGPLQVLEYIRDHVFIRLDGLRRHERDERLLEEVLEPNLMLFIETDARVRKVAMQCSQARGTATRAYIHDFGALPMAVEGRKQRHGFPLAPKERMVAVLDFFVHAFPRKAPTATGPRILFSPSAVKRGISERFRNGTPVKVREKLVDSPLLLKRSRATSFRWPFVACGGTTKRTSILAPEHAILRLGFRTSVFRDVSKL